MVLLHCVVVPFDFFGFRSKGKLAVTFYPESCKACHPVGVPMLPQWPLLCYWIGAGRAWQPEIMKRHEIKNWLFPVPDLFGIPGSNPLLLH